MNGRHGPITRLHHETLHYCNAKETGSRRSQISLILDKKDGGLRMVVVLPVNGEIAFQVEVSLLDFSI